VRTETRVQFAFAAAGAAIVGLGFYAAAQPSIYRQSSFWTSSPTYFAIRVGLLTVGLATIYAIARVVEVRGGRWLVLERLGQHSLFIYWIHVELVYGYASWLWRHRLPLWATALACLAFCALMYDAIAIRDALVARRPPRRQTPATAAV
jgi:fucose 4-O-acetylase-like acetyltransferase